jgi:hypothetical protein
MESLHGFLHGKEMDHVSWLLGVFSKHHLLEIDPTQSHEVMMAL